MRARCISFCSLLLFVILPSAFCQTPLSTYTQNNTSGCAVNNLSSGGYCHGQFAGMYSDPNSTTHPGSGTYNQPVVSGAQGQPDALEGAVNKTSVKTLLYPGSSTLAFAHMTPWFEFCHASATYPYPNGSGGYTPCNSHQETGYSYLDSTSAALVDSQLRDIQSRGFDGVTIDWYGQNNTKINGATQKIRDNLNGRCTGVNQGCFLFFALMLDTGDLKYNASCTSSTKSTSETCLINSINSFFDYARDFYFDVPSSSVHSKAYLRVSPSTRLPSASGQPVVLVWNNGPSFPAADFHNVWSQVQSHITSAAYSSNGNVPELIFRNSCGFSANPMSCNGNTTAWPHTDGAYAWLNFSASGVDDPNISYFQTFYREALCTYGITGAAWPCVTSNPTQTWGAAYKGADHVNEGFTTPDYKVMRQHCGRVWIDTMIEENAIYDQSTGAHYFSTSRQLPFMQVGTWNDYDEGTEVETGIDNCFAVGTPVVSSGVISANVAVSSDQPNASTYADASKTIDHYTVFDSAAADSQHILYILQDNLSTPSFSISSTNNLPCGNRRFYVRAVGKPMITNKMSPGGNYTTTCNVTLSPASKGYGSVLVGTQSSSQIFTLTNSGNSYLSISSISTTDNEFRITSQTCANPGQLNAGTSCTVTIQFAPTSAGAKSATLTIQHNDSTSGNQSTAALSGTGASCTTNCSSTLTPATFDFGSVTVGSQSAAHSFLFTNNGTSAVTPTISTSPGFSIVSAPCGSVPANGGTCSVSVSFAPTSTVAYSGSLTASDGNQVTLASATLSGSGSAAPPPPTNVLYEGVQNASGWTVCYDGTANCGGGNGGAFGQWTPNITSPSEPDHLHSGQTQNSALYHFTESSAYSNAKFQVQLGPQNLVDHLRSDMDLYITDPTAPVALVFTIKQVVNGISYPFQFQCDLKNNGVWNVWDPSSSWVSTGVSCDATDFPANHWVGLSFRANRVGGQMQYSSITVGGNVHNLSMAPFNTASQASQDAIFATMTFDGDSLLDPFDVYVDNMTIYNDGNLVANATLTPKTLDLGLIASGGLSEARPIVLTNNGTGSLSINSIGINNSQFSQTNNCGTSLGVGASCNINLTYRPSSVGTTNSVLTVSGGQTLTSNLTGTSLTPSKILYSQVQNDPWVVCNSCAGGNGGGAGTFLSNQATPRINTSNSARFAFTETAAYSNVLFEDDVAAQSAVTQFRQDVDLYFADPTKVHHFELQLQQVADGTSYPFQLSCDLNNGAIWKVWNPSAAGSHWVATSAPCSPSAFANNDWTHVSFIVQRTGGNQLQYVSVSIGTDTYSLGNVYAPSSQGATDSTKLKFVEGGDGNQDSYTVYLDNYTLSTP